MESEAIRMKHDESQRSGGVQMSLTRKGVKIRVPNAKSLAAANRSESFLTADAVFR
jgi:hypothetical protein